MIMESAKNYASVFAEQKVTDAVIICPAHFNQAERRALKRSAEMAGIKVLQLMNSHAAGWCWRGANVRLSDHNTKRYDTCITTFSCG